MSEPKYSSYGRQTIGPDDIEAVKAVLQSSWLTQGPEVSLFEEEFAQYVQSKEAIAVNSGTAALHCVYMALGLGQNDEVIMPALTFAATANALLWTGATPVFADIHPQTLNLDPEQVKALISPSTKAIVTVDFAGRPSNYRALKSIAEQAGIPLVSDSCHAVGAVVEGQPVGSLADMSCFSFHPVKGMTTGEGGMVTTNCSKWAAKIRRLRTHGIESLRLEEEPWRYDMLELGMNYRLSDLQAALGRTQLKKLTSWVSKRNQLAKQYYLQLKDCSEITLPEKPSETTTHAYHLFVIQVKQRNKLYQALKGRGVGVQVHYLPVYDLSYHAQRSYGSQGRLRCKNTNQYYQQCLTLPLFPTLELEDVNAICGMIKEEIAKWG